MAKAVLSICFCLVLSACTRSGTYGQSDSSAGDSAADEGSGPLGCVEGGSECRQLVPANGFASSSFGELAPITQTLKINTSTCTGADSSGGSFISGQIVDGAGSSKACLMAIQRLTVSSTGRVEAEGDNPLVLLVREAVAVEGVIDAGGRAEVPGPGGALGGAGPAKPGEGAGGGTVCGCAGESCCGGGGGGYGLAGGDGGACGDGCSTKSAGGPVHGEDDLTPLTGGSGGASGNGGNGLSAGGGGGGALQISCSGPMAISGVISAGGGGGKRGQGDYAGGGGGGSGGSILLEALSFSGSGLVAVNGGGGGAGIGSGCDNTSPNGEDGKPAMEAAKGGVGDLPDGCGHGGQGGTGFAAAGKGIQEIDGGGGGGGGVGRIRLNWLGHGPSTPLKVSGMVSTGEITIE